MATNFPSSWAELRAMIAEYEQQSSTPQGSKFVTPEQSEHGDAPSVESKETQQSAEKHPVSTIGKRFQHSKTPYDFDFEQSSGKSSMVSSRSSSSPAFAQGLEPESEMSPNTDPKRSNTHEFTTESSGMPRGRSNPVRIPFQQEVKPRTDTSAEKIK
jgi:hypothetical protein